MEVDEGNEEDRVLFPPGAIVRVMRGTDRNPYALVRLDRPFTCHHPGTEEMWTLTTLVLGMAARGDDLARMAHRGTRSPLLVHVAAPRKPIGESTNRLDLRDVEYFARGVAHQV